MNRDRYNLLERRDVPGGTFPNPCNERHGERIKRTVAIDEGDFVELKTESQELSLGRRRFQPADIIRGLIRDHLDARHAAAAEKVTKRTATNKTPAKQKRERRG